MAAVTLKPFLRIARPALYRCPLCGFKTNRKNGGLDGMCPNLCHWIIPNVQRVPALRTPANARSEYQSLDRCPDGALAVPIDSSYADKHLSSFRGWDYP